MPARSAHIHFKPLDPHFAESFKDEMLMHCRDLAKLMYPPVHSSLLSAFDENGNFPLRYDPYRTDYDLATWNAMAPDHQHEICRIYEIHNFIFDVESSVRPFVHKVLCDILKENPQWTFQCDAVKLYYAQKHGRNTSGSYPATYMWK